MSTLRERMEALMTFKALPQMHVDWATYRRLEAAALRLASEDPTLDPVEDFEHVIYALIVAGLTASELADRVRFDENTGLPS